jgi:hypothetical protein
MADPALVEALQTRVQAELNLLPAQDRAELGSSQSGVFAERPDLLHHYTSADGVLGIITTQSIYATNILFVNGSSEIRYGLSIAVNTMRALSKRLGYCFETNFLTSVIACIGEMEQANSPESLHIACFCESRDLLSQWRGYGGSGGYSLDFNTEIFDVWKPSERQLLKVIYDDKKQRELIESVINRYLSSLRRAFELDKGDFAVTIDLNAPTPPDIVEMGKLVVALVGSLVYLAAFFKSPTFREESEWRLITTCDATHFSDLRFRSNRGLLVPYVAIPIDVTDSSLASITCGPSPHGPLSKRSIELFLRQAGLKGVQVLGSEIPLKL